MRGHGFYLTTLLSCTRALTPKVHGITEDGVLPYLRNIIDRKDRLNRALGHLRHANSDEAAWWLGLLSSENNVRPLRALRILTEAVE